MLMSSQILQQPIAAAHNLWKITVQLANLPLFSEEQLVLLNL
jgi:hypothetical protein